MEFIFRSRWHTSSRAVWRYARYPAIVIAYICVFIGALYLFFHPALMLAAAIGWGYPIGPVKLIENGGKTMDGFMLCLHSFLSIAIFMGVMPVYYWFLWGILRNEKKIYGAGMIGIGVLLLGFVFLCHGATFVLYPQIKQPAPNWFTFIYGVPPAIGAIIVAALAIAAIVGILVGLFYACLATCDITENITRKLFHE